MEMQSTSQKQAGIQPDRAQGNSVIISFSLSALVFVFSVLFHAFLGHWLGMPVLGSNPTVIKIQEGLFIYKNSAVRLSSIECFD